MLDARLMSGMLACLLVATIFMPALAMGASDTVRLENTGEEIWYGGSNALDEPMMTRRMYADGNPAFCAQPAKTTPSTGEYHAEEPRLQDASGKPTQERFEELRAVLWFSAGGPGFDRDMWPTEDWDGSEVTDDELWAYSHVLVSEVMFGSDDRAVAGCDQRAKLWLKEHVVGKDGSVGQTVRDRMGEVPGTFEIFSLNAGQEHTQTVVSWRYRTGSARLLKTGANEALTQGNGLYSLAGAEYGVYASEADALADTNRLGTLVTGASGATNTLEDLHAGTYYARELKASPGYAVAASVISVVVNPGETATFQASELPQNGPLPISIRKADATTDAVPQGVATLAGAEFDVRYYAGAYDSAENVPEQPTRQWTLRTDERGETSLEAAANDPDTYLANGDEFYRSSTGQVCLPLGTVVVQETKAPAGYALPDDGAMTIWHISAEGTEESVSVPQQIIVQDHVILGGVEVQKYDLDTKGTSPQGDASLAGAGLSITNASDREIQVAGTRYAPGEVVTIITTNEQGYATTGAGALPYGTYRIYESKAPEGYLTNTEWEQTFSVDEDGAMASFTSRPSDGAEQATGLVDHIQHGSISVQKRDLQNDGTTPQGGASFEGAEITITNRGDKAVSVEGVTIEPGDVVQRMLTDASGLAVSKSLPYGTYELTETKAPKGYKLNTTWRKTVHVRDDGSIQEVTAPSGRMNEQGESETSGVANLVKRGDIAFNKISFPDQERLGHIAFLVESQTTGERHVIETDENGSWSSAASWNPHGSYTDDEGSEHPANGNDRAYDASENSVDESALDPLVGTWFFGSATDVGAEPNDAIGAFPYDTYTFQELRCEGNAGYQLVSFVVSVTRDGTTLDMGTVSDTIPSLKTKLARGEETDGSTTQLTDTVAYQSLIPGKEYTLELKLWDSTNQVFLDESELVEGDDGDLRASTTFSPTTPDGSIEQAIAINTNGLAGHTIVAYEYLYDHQGTLLAEHADELDRDQTVGFASLETTATGEDGKKVVALGESTIVRDTVSYRGLVAKEAYTLSTELHLVGADGSDDGIATDAEGNEAVARMTFLAESTEGSIAIDLPIDTSGLAGRSLVVFETLSKDDRIVATHADISDKDQTVEVQTSEEPPAQTTPPEKPITETPKEERPERLPQTGDSMSLVPVYALAGIAILIVVMGLLARR